MIHLILAESKVTAIELMPAITALVVFSLFFLVVATKVWPRILKGLEDRENKIRDEIKSAEEAREQAKAALEEYERSLGDAREEANRMIVQAKTDAKAAADDLKRRNEAEVAEMKNRATREIDSAKQAAIAELHNDAATLAAFMAGKILRRKISVDDQQRLVEDSLAEITSVRN